MAHPRVAILGPGLIGGSLALALQSTTIYPEVSLWGRSPDFLSAVLQAGLIASTDLSEIVQDADLIVFAVPVDVISLLARQVALLIKPTCVLTDAGSTKQHIVKDLEAIFQGRFIGSHPMAGSEKTGFAHADKDLFQKAPCIVTPTEITSPETLTTIKALWTTVGCQTYQMSPQAHDHLVARISHLPHVVASALVLLAAQSNLKAQDLSGGGYRDTTRIASGSPELWKAIIEDNQEEIVLAVDDLIVLLQEVRSMLVGNKPHQLHEFLLRAKTQRDRLK